ncbi:hypothetical protein CP488_01730 [Chthonomonas calidirosea]|nr:hypothetical protein CP488_01730 [Chthonomonas calidirosea]
MLFRIYFFLKVYLDLILINQINQGNQSEANQAHCYNRQLILSFGQQDGKHYPPSNYCDIH